MIRFPNRTGQKGIYVEDDTDYIDVSDTSTPYRELGLIPFNTQAAAYSWETGDVIGIVIKVDSDNYKVWAATWDDTNSYLVLDTEEESVGTIADGATVTVASVLTTATFSMGVDIPSIGYYNTVADSTYTLLSSDAGKVIRFTSSSAVTVTLSNALPEGFQCIVAQVGAGTVSCAREGTDTINGGSTAVPLAKQWALAYICQPTEGEWEVYA
jgi:hypothetical protein